MPRAALLVLVCLIVPIHAQNTRISADMNVDSDTLHKWLHGDDPRLVAWAADFAYRRHDAALISEMPAVLERWSASPNEIQSLRCRAVLLDALIQESMPVSVRIIQEAADTFPAQAMLLIQRVPLRDARSTLAEWTFGPDGSIRGTRSRAAAMILAKSPDSSFVARVFEGIVQHVLIRIALPNTGFGGGGGMAACSDGVAGPPAQGWPPIYEYGLREGDGSSLSAEERTNVIPVVKLGSHNIMAVRYEESAVLSACSSVYSEAGLRHELVAYWLGLKPDEMEWQLNASLEVEWTTKPAYEYAVGSFLETQRAQMSRTLRQLEDQGLIDRKAMKKFPQISISYECDLNPCPLPGVVQEPVDGAER